MYQNENLHSSSITLIKSRNHPLTLMSDKADSKNHNMKIPVHFECICKNAIFMQFYVIIPDWSTFIYTTCLKCQEIIGDLPVESISHKFLAKFHSGTSSIIDTMRLISLFWISARTSIRIPLNNFAVWSPMSFKSDLETCKVCSDLICEYELCILSSIEVGAAKDHGKSYTLHRSCTFSVHHL